eukprot:Gb_20293 [translate_table: standard]
MTIPPQHRQLPPRKPESTSSNRSSPEDAGDTLAIKR